MRRAILFVASAVLAFAAFVSDADAATLVLQNPEPVAHDDTGGDAHADFSVPASLGDDWTITWVREFKGNELYNNRIRYSYTYALASLWGNSNLKWSIQSWGYNDSRVYLPSVGTFDPTNPTYVAVQGGPRYLRYILSWDGASKTYTFYDQFSQVTYRSTNAANDYRMGTPAFSGAILRAGFDPDMNYAQQLACMQFYSGDAGTPFELSGSGGYVDNLFYRLYNSSPYDCRDLSDSTSPGSGSSGSGSAAPYSSGSASYSTGSSSDWTASECSYEALVDFNFAARLTDVPSGSFKCSKGCTVQTAVSVSASTGDPAWKDSGSDSLPFSVPSLAGKMSLYQFPGDIPYMLNFHRQHDEGVTVGDTRCLPATSSGTGGIVYTGSLAGAEPLPPATSSGSSSEGSGSVSDGFSGFFGAIYAGISDVASSVGNGLSTAASWIGSAVTKGANAVASTVSGAINAASSTAASVGNAVGEAVHGVSSAITSGFSSLRDGIVGLFPSDGFGDGSFTGSLGSETVGTAFGGVFGSLTGVVSPANLSNALSGALNGAGVSATGGSSAYLAGNSAMCDMFNADGSFRYYSNGAGTFSIDLSWLKGHFSLFGIGSYFDGLVDFLQWGANLFTLVLNNFLSTLRSIWVPADGSKVCFLGTVLEIRYQKALFATDQLFTQKWYVKGEMNVIDYVFLLIGSVAFVGFLFSLVGMPGVSVGGFDSYGGNFTRHKDGTIRDKKGEATYGLTRAGRQYLKKNPPKYDK